MARKNKVAQETVVNGYGYDDEAVVEAIARGAKTYTEIAAEHGVTRQCISQIARGRRRRELHPEIMALQEGYLLQARRLAVACAVQIMAAHIREGLEGEGETARKCREYVLNRVLGQPGEATPSLPEARPAEFDIDAIASWFGGRPEEDEELPLAAPGSFEEKLLNEHRWIYRLKTRAGRLRALQELKAAEMAEEAEKELREKGKDNGNDAERPATADLRQADGRGATTWEEKDNCNDAERRADGERGAQGKGPARKQTEKEAGKKVREVVRRPLSTS